jgi:hypothetical protein
MGEGMSAKDELARWVANHLPRRVIYFAVVRAWNAATTNGRWLDTEATEITVSETLSRCHVIMRDGGWM